MVDRAQASVTVAADPQAVLRVIADFPGYPEWVHFIKRAEVLRSGPDGRAARVRFQLDAGPVKDDYTLDYEWSADGVSWHLVEGRTQKFQEGSYRLRRTDAGTEVTYQLAVETALRLPGLIKRRAQAAIVDTALKGLKKRVEQFGDDR